MKVKNHNLLTVKEADMPKEEDNLGKDSDKIIKNI